MQKKGQAAMEFLQNYGWAIIIVLIAIGSLAYFGVLDINKFVSAKCTLQGGFDCREFVITEQGAQFELTNNLGVDTEIVSVDVDVDLPNECNALHWNDGALLDTGDSIWISHTPSLPVTGAVAYSTDGVCTLEENGNFKGTITVNYTKEGETYQHIARGIIQGRTEN